ncbi:uncharacterized protein LOC125677957 [Ostrea edulis]|uniref:uncharacterized protein LOC125677957 n=1 Tax=Ostrea edulis TaxID=37623 RepID=UPI002094881B|nr:uncharacterized protein LOC125677957 [Ostrea edulis]
MKGLAVQVLAAILLFVSLSYSQEQWEGQKFPKYAVVDKHINVREIIRFGGREGEGQNDVEESEVPEEAGSRGFSASSMLTMLSNAAKIRKVKNMLPLSGIQWLKDDDDTGKAINCGPAGSHLIVTWKPRIIDPQKSVRISFDIVNPIDFDKGKGHVDVYMEDSPDPIFSVDQDIACQDLAKQFPVRCPMKKGEIHKATFTYSDLSKLPTGSYTIVLKIFSYASNPPPLFGCLNMTLKIVPSANRFAHPFPQVIV